MNEIQTAKDIIATEGEGRIAATVETLVADGAAHWILDPHVPGVVGLVDNDTREALVVVYTDERDFEVGETMEDLLFA